MLSEFGLVETRAKSVKVGDKFGRLEVVAVGQRDGTYRYYAICKCSCGSDIKSIRMDNLTDGLVVSCGCYQKEQTTSHGLTSSEHYGRWRNMMDRCYNRQNAAYKNYGGRGVKVCDAWHDVSTFVSELPDGYFEGAEMDRINNDGDYEPGNIRWADKSLNCDNRRSGHMMTIEG